MLEAMARIAPSQPNEAMACIASRRKRTILLDQNLPVLNSLVDF
jgi:protein tyrosine/serine phosphatase